MARLPIPGSDSGTWGQVLNDYLSQVLAADGTLKDNVVSPAALAPGAVDSGALQDGTITPVKLSSNSPASGQVLSYNGSGFAWIAPQTVSATPDATTSTKGIVQLAGDLSGTAASPTVPGLAGKANTVHAHAASDINSGTLDIARIPTGSTGTTVSLGNHAHTGVYLPVKNGTAALTDSTNDRFARVDISDDASASSGWPDRLAFYFNGTRTGYHNEYGELRARPAKASTVALRAMYFGSGSANIFEVAPSAAGVEYFAVSSSAASLSVPLSSTQNISTTGTVTGSNIGAKVTASSTAPASPAVGDVWVDLSA